MKIRITEVETFDGFRIYSFAGHNKSVIGRFLVLDGTKPVLLNAKFDGSDVEILHATEADRYYIMYNAVQEVFYKVKPGRGDKRESCPPTNCLETG